jgi:hypothetical protein
MLWGISGLFHYLREIRPSESKFHETDYKELCGVVQRFSNFFQVGTTFIIQNVLRTTLLLSPLKEN